MNETTQGKLLYALKQFVDYYDQAGIGECLEGHDDDDDGFDGDERFNVRLAREAITETERSNVIGLEGPTAAERGREDGE